MVFKDDSLKLITKNSANFSLSGKKCASEVGICILLSHPSNICSVSIKKVSGLSFFLRAKNLVAYRMRKIIFQATRTSFKLTRFLWIRGFAMLLVLLDFIINHDIL